MQAVHLGNCASLNLESSPSNPNLEFDLLGKIDLLELSSPSSVKMKSILTFASLTPFYNITVRVNISFIYFS